MFSDQFINLKDEESVYNMDFAYEYMVNSFVHELGHAFANNKIFGKDRDETKEWKAIFNQIVAKEDRENYFRDYAVTNPAELFADVCRDYYNKPNNLKMVEIEINGYDNLYDYMNDLMGGES